MAAALAIFFWWLLSDREPTQKEMTFAYRKHVIKSNEEVDAKDQMELRQRLDEIELVKQRCEKLGKNRYRCEAVALMESHPVESLPPEGSAIYARDALGWQFEAPVKE